MKYLVIVFLFISSFLSGQGIEPTSLQPTQYQGGILRGVIPYVDEFTGETLYIYQHVDSLVFVKDSIYVRNDSIFLRDGTGFAIVTDSIYVVTGVSKDTIKLRDGDGYVLMDKQSQNRVRGTGTATRVAWWGGTDSLSSSANLYWDNANNTLNIDNIRYTSNSTEQISIGNVTGDNTANSSYSNFIGHYAGTNAVTAPYSNMIGYVTGYNATNANNSNFIGYGSGAGATNANNSNFFGSLAGYQATNANKSNFFGYEAGYQATYAGSSMFFGERAGYQATEANSSFFFGERAGYQAVNSSLSIHFGYQSGQSFTGNVLGSNNIIFGSNVSLPNTRANSLNIGGVLFGTGLNSNTAGDPKIIPTSGGKIGVMEVSPQRELHVTGEVRITDLTTDPATNIVGSDADGDLSNMTLGSGLSISGGTLNTVNNGTVTSVTASSPLASSGGTTPNISIQNASTSTTGALTSTDWNIFNGKVGGSGTSTRVAFWSGTSTLSSSANLYWDNTNSRLGIGTTSPTKKLQVNGGLQLGDASVNEIDFRLTRTSSTIPADAGYYIASSNTPIHSYIEGGYMTAERSGTVTSANSGYPYYEEYYGMGGSTAKTYGFINKTSGSFTSTDLVPIITMLRTSKIGINTAIGSIDRTLTVGGEVKITDLVTTTPTKIMSVDNDGVLSSLGLSGLTITGGNLTNSNTGTVTSVGITPGSGISVSGSPVTSSGNITVNNTGVLNLYPTGGGSPVTGNGFIGTNATGTYPSVTSSSGVVYVNFPGGSSGQVLKHNGTGWTAGTDNIGMSSWNFSVNGGAAYNMGDGWNQNFANGTGISWSRSGQTLTATNTGDLSNTNELQTLSWSSPNISISGGNSVALPVLPSGSTNQTLRHDGSSWSSTSGVTVTSGNRMDINSWPGTVNLGSKLLVNGHIQYTNTGFQASTITGRDTDGGLTGVTVGSGLSLSGGTLTATDASTSNEIQTLSHSAPTLSISSGNSITLTQQYGQMSSNGGCATVSTSYGTTVSGTAIGNNVTVSSTTITVPATGTYELNYSGYFILDPTASNVGVGMRVRKNGSSTVSVTIENIQGTASTEYRAMSKNIIVSLNSGDTLVLQPTKDAGTVNLCDYVMNIIRLN